MKKLLASLLVSLSTLASATTLTRDYSDLWYNPTTGPYFGAPTFNPNNVTVTPVGTATFLPTSAATGTFTYTINTVAVTKNVTRQTWRTENIAGIYQGATIGTYTGCASGNGPYDSTASFTITQAAQSVTIAEFGAGYQCNYTGFINFAGRMGTITGSGSCTPGGVPETFTATEVQSSPDGLAGRIDTAAGTCRLTGRFGGLRRQ